MKAASLHAARAWEWSRGTALASALAAGELSLACHREHGSQAFTVDDIGLANLAQSVVHLVRQLSTFESNLESSVRTIRDCNMLAGDCIGLAAWRDQVNHLIVLNLESPSYSARQLPADDVLVVDAGESERVLLIYA